MPRNKTVLQEVTKSASLIVTFRPGATQKDFKNVDEYQRSAAINDLYYNLSQAVPEFKANPAFVVRQHIPTVPTEHRQEIFNEETGKRETVRLPDTFNPPGLYLVLMPPGPCLVPKSKYRYYIKPQVLGLDPKDLEEEQTVRLQPEAKPQKRDVPLLRMGETSFGGPGMWSNCQVIVVSQSNPFAHLPTGRETHIAKFFQEALRGAKPVKSPAQWMTYADIAEAGKKRQDYVKIGKNLYDRKYIDYAIRNLGASDWKLAKDGVAAIGYRRGTPVFVVMPIDVEHIGEVTGYGPLPAQKARIALAVQNWGNAEGRT